MLNARTGLGVLLVSLGNSGCGARNELRDGLLPASDLDCQKTEDCGEIDLCAPVECVEGQCTSGAVVECISEDICEEAACDRETGQCVTTPRTLDLDGDGFRAPLPGFAPGESGSCGEDCDDTSALAFPEGQEVCDGVDNDCDGVIDNGQVYLTTLAGEIPEVIQVASDLDGSGKRGAAYGDGTYFLGYWGRDDLSLGYLRGLTASGEEVFSQTPVANVNAPSFGPDVVWNGVSFAAIWSDPRVDDNYEIYFARFNGLGEKLSPDLRLTDASDFSIHPDALFDQGRYLVVWDDRRAEDLIGGPQIFGQLVSELGEVLGENILLSGEEEVAEYPAISATARRYGIVYTSLNDESVSLRFRSVDKDLVSSSDIVVLARTDARSPRITAVGDLFVVSWDVYGIGPGDSIMAAVLSEQGEVLIPPQAITAGATFARSHHTVSLGDRFVLLWVDDLDGNFELYAKVLGVDLGELEPRVRLTDDPADTLSPYGVLGDSGRLGVLFDDWRSGTHHTYFTSIGCAAAQSVR